jgi:hypothetical protein
VFAVQTLDPYAPLTLMAHHFRIASGGQVYHRYDRCDPSDFLLHSLFTIDYSLLLPFRIVKQNPTIRRITALFLLLVFLVSAAPKAYFHDLVADHKDVVTTCHHANPATACVHQSAINCHFDQLVVSSFYFFSFQSFSAVAPELTEVPFSCPPAFHLVKTFHSRESRGPPVI